MGPTVRCEDCFKLDKSGKDVYIRQGDLLLCEKCNKTRFQSMKFASPRVNQANNDEETIPKDILPQDISQISNKDVYHNELLSYLYYHYSNSSIDMIRKTIISFYSPDDITVAKDLIWETNKESLLTSKQRRISTAVRSAHEADFNDIISALNELDQKGDLVIGKYYAVNFSKIPKCSPEEMNSLAIIDRLRALELQISEVKDLTLDNRSRIDRNEEQMSTSTVTMTKTSEKVDSLERKINNDVEQVNNDERLYSDVAASAASAGQAVNLFDNAYVSNTKTDNNKRSSLIKENSHKYSRGLFSSRGRGNHRGTGHGRNQTLHNPLLSYLADSLQSIPHSVDSEFSNSIAPSEPGFRYQHNYEKKLQRKKRVVKGRATNQTLKGAPPPSREVFIYRVDKEATCDELKQYVESGHVAVRDLVVMSHEHAMFKSFKLTISVADLSKIYDEDFWPDGIMVRRFNKPRQDGYAQ